MYMCLIHNERTKSTPAQEKNTPPTQKNELLSGNRNAPKEDAHYTANVTEKYQMAEGSLIRLIQSSWIIRSEAVFQCASPRVDAAASWH